MDVVISILDYDDNYLQQRQAAKVGRTNHDVQDRVL